MHTKKVLTDFPHPFLFHWHSLCRTACSCCNRSVFVAGVRHGGVTLVYFLFWLVVGDMSTSLVCASTFVTDDDVDEGRKTPLIVLRCGYTCSSHTCRKPLLSPHPWNSRLKLLSFQLNTVNDTCSWLIQIWKFHLKMIVLNTNTRMHPLPGGGKATMYIGENIGYRAMHKVQPHYTKYHSKTQNRCSPLHELSCLYLNANPVLHRTALSLGHHAWRTSRHPAEWNSTAMGEALNRPD